MDLLRGHIISVFNLEAEVRGETLLAYPADSGCRRGALL